MSLNFKVFVFAAVVAFVVGAMNEANVMYVLAGVCVAVVLIAFGLSRLALTRLSAELSVAAGRCQAGSGLRAVVHVRSIGSITLPSAGLSLTATNLTIPGLEVTQRLLLPPLPPASEAEVEARLACPARGRYRVGPVQLFDSDPIGMFEYERAQGEAVEVLALPATVDLPRLSSWEVRTGGEGGRALAARRDHGEFRGIREHSPGDDLRHVHWKVTAHSGELAVKEYEPIRHDMISLHLDLRAANHAGDGTASTLETAISAAASIAREALAEQRLVAVHGDGLPTGLTTPGAGEPTLHRIMVALAEVQGNGQRTFTEALSKQLARARRGASVFVITTAAEEAIAEVLAPAARRGLSVRVLLAEPPEGGDPEATQQLMARLHASGVGAGRLRSVADIADALVAAAPVSVGPGTVRRAGVV